MHVMCRDHRRCLIGVGCCCCGWCTTATHCSLQMTTSCALPLDGCPCTYAGPLARLPLSSAPLSFVSTHRPRGTRWCTSTLSLWRFHCASGWWCPAVCLSGCAAHHGSLPRPCVMRCRYIVLVAWKASNGRWWFLFGLAAPVLLFVAGMFHTGHVAGWDVDVTYALAVCVFGSAVALLVATYVCCCVCQACM